MTTWTLMRDAVPVDLWTFDGTARDMLKDDNVHEVSQFVEGHRMADSLWPATDHVLMIGASYSGEDVYQLVEEGARWLEPEQVEWLMNVPLLDYK